MQQVTLFLITKKLPAYSITIQRTLMVSSKNAYLYDTMDGDYIEANILISLSAFSFYFVESWFILTFLRAYIC